MRSLQSGDGYHRRRERPYWGRDEATGSPNTYGHPFAIEDITLCTKNRYGDLPPPQASEVAPLRSSACRSTTITPQRQGPVHPP